jgi:hypothetical protein
MSARGDSNVRAAQNEDLFRRLNERLRALAAHTHSEREAKPGLERFVCECAQKDCTRVIQLSEDEYASVRAVSRRFCVYPDASHTEPALEHVVERTERYWVVQKHGEAGEEAAALRHRRTDPM